MAGASYPREHESGRAGPAPHLSCGGMSEGKNAHSGLSPPVAGRIAGSEVMKAGEQHYGERERERLAPLLGCTAELTLLMGLQMS